MIALLIFWRNELFRWATAYYVVSLFFLLKFRTHDLVVAADRYMYLPSMGFCFLFGFYADRWLNQTRTSGKAMPYRFTAAILISVGILLATVSWRQSAVWKDDLTLWNHTIKHNPDVFLAYNGRMKDNVD
jgi:hypothetical protein